MPDPAIPAVDCGEPLVDVRLDGFLAADFRKAAPSGGVHASAYIRPVLVTSRTPHIPCRRPSRDAVALVWGGDYPLAAAPFIAGPRSAGVDVAFGGGGRTTSG